MTQVNNRNGQPDEQQIGNGNGNACGCGPGTHSEAAACCMVGKGSEGSGDGEAKRTQCCEGVRCCIDPDFFKALCDPTRIEVLLCLARACDPRTVSDVASCCAVDLSVVSRHLKTLRDAGIADSEKQGKEVRYQIRYGNVVGTLRALADAIEQCCPEGKYDQAVTAESAGTPK